MDQVDGGVVVNGKRQALFRLTKLPDNPIKYFVSLNVFYRLPSIAFYYLFVFFSSMVTD
jgi:hypothetical protein